MSTTEEIEKIIRITDGLRIIRKAYSPGSLPMTDLPVVIRALAGVPALTNEELVTIYNAELAASRIMRAKINEIKQLRAEDCAGS